MCATVSWLIQSGYMPAGSFWIAGEGPLAVRTIGMPENAAPLDGRASTPNTPTKATRAIKSRLRTVIR